MLVWQMSIHIIVNRIIAEWNFENIVFLLALIGTLLLLSINWHGPNYLFRWWVFSTEKYETVKWIRTNREAILGSRAHVYSTGFIFFMVNSYGMNKSCACYVPSPILYRYLLCFRFSWVRYKLIEITVIAEPVFVFCIRYSSYSCSASIFQLLVYF